MKKYEFIQVKKPILHWRGILDEWVSLINKIYDDIKGEYSPYTNAWMPVYCNPEGC